VTLFTLGVVWLAGIALGQTVILQPWPWLLMAGMAAAGAVLFRRLIGFRRLYVALLVGFLGAARSSAALPPSGPGSLSFYNDLPGRPTVVGRIVAYPDVRDAYTGLRVAAESIAFQPGEPPRPVRGLLLVRASRFQASRSSRRKRAVRNESSCVQWSAHCCKNGKSVPTCDSGTGSASRAVIATPPSD